MSRLLGCPLAVSSKMFYSTVFSEGKTIELLEGEKLYAKLCISLERRSVTVVLNQGSFGNVWRHFWVLLLEGGATGI